jgi:hypothetical protein
MRWFREMDFDAKQTKFGDNWKCIEARPEFAELARRLGLAARNEHIFTTSLSSAQVTSRYC